MSTPFPKFWPERAEEIPRYEMNIPPWGRLADEAVTMQREMIAARAVSPDAYVQYGVHHRRYGTTADAIPPEAFDMRNINCFQRLPSVQQERLRVLSTVGRALPPDLPQAYVGTLLAQLNQETAHTLYHLAMWRRHGRRVYVLDDTTFRLLALTELPPLPCSLLTMPEHAFFLKFPRGAFTFSVFNQYARDTDTGALGQLDTQECEGVLVAMDNIEPDSPRPRELSFMAVGTNPARWDDSNIAYISLTLGADARLCDVRIQSDDTDQLLMTAQDSWIHRYGALNEREMGQLLPRVILGLLLYLQSEHPDIEPIPPAPRRTFHDIRSPQQRATALQRQEERLHGATRLPILYVGRHLADAVQAEVTALHPEAVSPRGGGVHTWTLDHPVWVRGHWRHQPYGAGRTLRRMTWIRPHLRGPDVAETLRRQAYKVQRAQPARKEER